MFFFFGLFGFFPRQTNLEVPSLPPFPSASGKAAAAGSTQLISHTLAVSACDRPSVQVVTAGRLLPHLRHIPGLESDLEVGACPVGGR